ncbi:MAG TPA: Ig-like domain-containing protein [Rhodothermales bacterium]|nr:Ig-like domain-containing protein [Rhodothermales bacterium]
MPPTGGPVDKTPPALAEAVPASGAVNVDARSVRITFSEYVNPQTLPRALNVSPAFEGRLDYAWHGRRATIIFPEPLRENTTYVLTLDTNLKDANGVGLAQPITLAFSTGPTINRGKLAGRVVDPNSGKGVAGVDVFAYALPGPTQPASLPDRPEYRTQTEPDGRFQFQYLNEQPYFVLALEDRNRNRKPDVAEPVAVPPAPVVIADTTVSDSLRRWFLAVLDTVPPALQRIQALSGRRIELRFDEPVHLSAVDSTAWVLRDSLRDTPVPLRGVYTIPSERQQVYVLTDSLAAGAVYRLRLGGVADTVGNVLPEQFASFTASDQPDTVKLRFLGFLPDSARTNDAGSIGLAPGDSFGVRFNEPVESERLNRIVALTDTSGAAMPYQLETWQGAAYLFSPDPPVAPGTLMELHVNSPAFGGPDTTYTRTFRYLPQRLLGELSGYIAAPDATASVIVELYPPGSEHPETQRIPAAPSSRFLFSNLPEGSYRLRAFIDENGNGTWDSGRIIPYEPAERLAWSTDSLRVRARWESEMPDTLRIPTR